MSLTTVIVSIAFAALGVGVALWVNLVPAERIATRMARRVERPLPEAPLRERIVRRAQHVRRWVVNGATLGLLVTLGVVLAAVAAGRVPDPEASLAWIALGGLVLGEAAGALLGVLTDRAETDPSRPRVAHARHTSLRDYLDPIELIGARVVTALALAAGTATALVLVVAPRTSTGLTVAHSELTPAALALPLAAIASLVALEWGGRRIVLTRPRPATTPEALVWDDAQRADELRTLATAPLMTGLYGFILGLPGLFALVPRGAVDDTVLLVAVNLGGYLLFLALLVVLAFAIARKPARFYLRRLWPEVAAREEEQANAAARARWEAEARARVGKAS
jgi:hypothetical protein